MSAPKVYLSCIDAVMDLEQAAGLTQQIQHLAIAAFADSIGGAITFYTAEDPLTRSSQSLMRSALAKQPPVDGVIFYRLKQFFYGPTFDFGFLRDISAAGYEVHFARERISIRDQATLENIFPELYCYEALNSADKVADIIAMAS